MFKIKKVKIIEFQLHSNSSSFPVYSWWLQYENKCQKLHHLREYVGIFFTLINMKNTKTKSIVLLVVKDEETRDSCSSDNNLSALLKISKEYFLNTLDFFPLPWLKIFTYYQSASDSFQGRLLNSYLCGKTEH